MSMFTDKSEAITPVTLAEAKARYKSWTKPLLNSAAMHAFRHATWQTDALGRVILQGQGETLYFVRDANGRVYSTFDNVKNGER